ncbi:MAG TPA: lytic transglycosylase domain-containing protein [Blastocatellia bacterium]|nr:lytic transglycosylase domain-containing protein [Blastocatellia bacterium]
MHRLLPTLCFLIPLCGLLTVAALADQVQLKDGRVIEAAEVWEVGDLVWYRQGRLIASVSKADVLRVIAARPSTATSPRQPQQTAPAVVRIVLKNGPEIVADEVQEYDRFIRYRLGSLQTLIDREAVERIMRGEPAAVPPTVPQPGLPFTTGHTGLDQLIERAALRHQLDPLIIYLVMREESGFNHRAVSHAGARGLMQLMPATARRLGVRNIHDPVENIEAGTRHLKNLIELYQGDVNLALAAYNAGEEAVARYGRRVPPYRETQNYVRRINAAWRRAKAIEMKGAE